MDRLLWYAPPPPERRTRSWYASQPSHQIALVTSELERPYLPKAYPSETRTNQQDFVISSTALICNREQILKSHLDEEAGMSRIEGWIMSACSYWMIDYIVLIWSFRRKFWNFIGMGQFDCLELSSRVNDVMYCKVTCTGMWLYCRFTCIKIGWLWFASLWVLSSNLYVRLFCDCAVDQYVCLCVMMSCVWKPIKY